MIVPVIKNGSPIVSGVSYHDPSMLWNNFMGDLQRFTSDVITGTRDLVSLYGRYGTRIWERLPDFSNAGAIGKINTPVGTVPGIGAGSQTPTQFAKSLPNTGG